MKTEKQKRDKRQEGVKLPDRRQTDRRQTDRADESNSDKMTGVHLIHAHSDGGKKETDKWTDRKERERETSDQLKKGNICHS